MDAFVARAAEERGVLLVAGVLVRGARVESTLGLVRWPMICGDV